MVEEFRKDVLSKLHDLGGVDAKDDYTKGWDEAINIAYDEISRIQNKDEFNAISFYKSLKNQSLQYHFAYQLLCYGSVDAYLDKPTDEEFNVIANASISAYLKSDDSSLCKIADCLSEKYSKKELSLKQIQNMSKSEILELVN